MRASQVFTLVAAGLGASAAPTTTVVAPRAVIDHDAVVGFAEAGSALALQFKPWLKVVNGCVPFPAVDADGNTSGGLDTTGGSSSDCDSSTGQVYSREGAYGDYYAIMYSWYMPKDSPSSGLGHRHDWENIVVWLDSAASATMVGLSTSAHGDYDTITSDFPVDGTRPKIQYYSIWPVNHQLGTTDEVGGEQPLIAWDDLTDAARAALSDTDFGDATVPFKDDTFESNLAEASP
ncbi:NPP1-domain-containing protein [Xylariomycetidae sp. FL2044]|nr:NPP1-domain-containing protein [Xylariomycetidae sp. FL2044]